MVSFIRLICVAEWKLVAGWARLPLWATQTAESKNVVSANNLPWKTSYAKAGGTRWLALESTRVP